MLELKHKFLSVRWEHAMVLFECIQMSYFEFITKEKNCNDHEMENVLIIH